MLNKLKLYLCIKLITLQSKSLIENDIIYNYTKLELKERDQDKLIKQLRDLVIKDTHRNINIYNYDEIELILRKQHNYLFDFNSNELNENSYYDRCIDIIDDFTKSFISIRDGKIVYKYWAYENDEKLIGTDNDSIKIHIMEYLMRYIASDILIVNFIVMSETCDENQLDGVFSNITMADLLLEKVLEQGVTENHMHMGAGFNFSFSWQQMMNNILLERKSEQYEIFRYENVEKYLAYAGFIRILIAFYISEYDNHKFNDISKYFNENLSEYHYILENIVYNKVIDLEQSKELALKLTKKMGVTVDLNIDVVFTIFNSKINTTGENLFLFKTLTFIKDKKDCEILKMLFLKYTRIKNYIYTLIVQSNEVSGLTSFKEFYASASNSTYNLITYWETFFKHNFQNPYLRKLEGRMSINPIYDSFKNEIKQILIAYKNILNTNYKNDDVFPKFGIVFHFIKSRDTNIGTMCWKNYDKKRETTHKNIAYKVIQNKYECQLENLLKLRNEIPYLSEFLLGIDAASGENDTPVCVFAPIFASARDAKKDYLFKYDGTASTKIPQKSLMFTFHAGEDFRHILSGLRRIDEVVEHCKFHTGDRIGHGIALSCDAKDWQEKYILAVIPRFEYFENLLWVWGLFSKDYSSNVEISMYLEREILKYAKDIYSNLNGINVSMLYDAYKKSFEYFTPKYGKNHSEDTDDVNEKKIFCMKETEEDNKVWDIDKLLHTRSCACFLERMNEPIFVEVTDINVKIIEDVQKIVSNKLSTQGIVVELNPTSNLAVGEIKNIEKHHAFKLQCVENNNDLKNVIMNVNTDDPTVFSNNISNEFALLYYALISKKYSRDEALDWIDKMRKYGMKTSFIGDMLSDNQYMNYLDETIKLL